MRNDLLACQRRMLRILIKLDREGDFVPRKLYNRKEFSGDERYNKIALVCKSLEQLGYIEDLVVSDTNTVKFLRLTLNGKKYRAIMLKNSVGNFLITVLTSLIGSIVTLLVTHFLG